MKRVPIYVNALELSILKELLDQSAKAVPDRLKEVVDENLDDLLEDYQLDSINLANQNYK